MEPESSYVMPDGRPLGLDWADRLRLYAMRPPAGALTSVLTGRAARTKPRRVGLAPPLREHHRFMAARAFAASVGCSMAA